MAQAALYKRSDHRREGARLDSPDKFRSPCSPGAGSVPSVNDRVRRDHENLKAQLRKSRVLWANLFPGLVLRDVDLEI